MNQRKIRLSAVLISCIALIGAASFAALALFAGRGDASLDRVRSSGALRIGYAVEAPYAFVDADGRITGESPAAARDIARRLGIARIEWIQVPFSELISSLQERRYDLIAAGLFVTRERAEQVLFSTPTLRVRPGLLVPKNNPQSIRSLAGLRTRRGVRLAAIDGSVEQRRLKALGFPDAAIMTVPDLQSGQAAVKSGLANALLLSLPTLQRVARANRNYFDVVADAAAAADDRQVDYVAFAFNRQDAALQQAWNKAADGWIGSAAHLQAIAPFGFGAADIAALPKAVGAIDHE
jgi:polar amino acid transport system substrate-binding protein